MKKPILFLLMIALTVSLYACRPRAEEDILISAPEKQTPTASTPPETEPTEQNSTKEEQPESAPEKQTPTASTPPETEPTEQNSMKGEQPESAPSNGSQAPEDTHDSIPCAVRTFCNGGFGIKFQTMTQHLMTSGTEMQTFCETFREQYRLKEEGYESGEGNKTGEAFFARYDEAFFASHDLLLILADHSAKIDYQAIGLRRLANTADQKQAVQPVIECRHYKGDVGFDCAMHGTLCAFEVDKSNGVSLTGLKSPLIRNKDVLIS